MSNINFNNISDHDANMAKNVLEEISNIKDFEYNGAELVIDGVMNEVYAMSSNGNKIVYSAKNDKMFTDTDEIISYDLDDYNN